MTHPRQVRYDGDLPACCARSSWRLPRPNSAAYSVTSSSSDDGWDLGFDRWVLNVHAMFFDLDRQLLEDSMSKHLRGGSGEVDLERALRDHGVELEPVDLGLDEVWAAEVTVVRARLADEWRQAAGRLGPRSGTDLLRAADDDSQALLELVEPLLDHDGGLWSDAVLAVDPDAEACPTLVVLEGAVVTPALRGHGLGAWAAASALVQVVDGSTLVAARAYPLDRDGMPLAGDDLDSRSFAFLCGAAQLANYWSSALGLTPIPQYPDLLIYNSMMQNPELSATLSTYA